MMTDSFASLCGYASAVPTPFKDQLVDEGAFARFCEWQLDEGIAALVVAGTTGEAATLSLDEHARLIAIAVEVAHGRVPVIAGAGSPSTAHAIEIARQAETVGADGLLAVTPYYNKPSQEGLLRHFGALHDATGLPILLYDVPARTGCSLAQETICRLAALERIVGLKDATGDLARPVALRHALGNRLQLWSGDDATALDFIALGGRGCISVASNAAPRLCGKLYLGVAAGERDEARLLERRLRPLVQALFLESNPVPLKWALSLMGWMSPELRLPLCEPMAATRYTVEAALSRLGLTGRNRLMRSALRVLTPSG